MHLIQRAYTYREKRFFSTQPLKSPRLTLKLALNG